MGNKTVMVLVIPEPKVRKATARAERPHKDKTRYTRKVKHKAPYGAFFMPGVLRQLHSKGGGASSAFTARWREERIRPSSMSVIKEYHSFFRNAGIGEAGPCRLLKTPKSGRLGLVAL